MATEIESLKSDINRIEFGIWAATDEVTRRKAAIKKEKKKLRELETQLEKI
ncbi:hypothetical protein KAS24_06430 [Candidatus Bathyarchaeota archaeon]|nr:hypothetical protein [Candidatus Bathyarchaeota archaeon]